MTTLRKPPSDADLWDRYAKLPASAKLVLHLKGLLFLPTTKTVFLECLTRSGLRAPDGKAWSSRSVNVVLEELRRQCLLTEDLACPPALLHPVAADAAASAHGDVLVAAVRRAFPARRSMSYYSSGQQVDCDALRRLIRLAVYANDAAGFSASRELHDKECGPSRAADLLGLLFTAIPLGADWLASRHPAIQLALFDAKLSTFLQTGVPGPDLAALVAHYRAQQEQAGFAAIRPALLLFDLLAGRLGDVQHGIAAIEDPADVTRQMLEGTVEFLSGRNDAALQHYRDALKLHRKQAGKRKLFLDGVHGLFFLMALLRANDAALQKEVQAGIDAVLSSPSAYAGGVLALQALLWLAQGPEPKARALLGQLRAAMPAEPLSAACVALAEHAVDVDLTHAHRTNLEARFEHLKTQLPLIARIYAEILASVAESPTPYKAYLAQAGQGLEIAFTGLIQVRQPWERALESLDAFLGAGPTKAATGPGPRKPKRLVWFLDPDTRTIEVAEQSAKGKDGWTDGRAVAMKRLHERDPRLDYLTEQDRTALRSIRKETSGYYGDESYDFDTLRTIPALVGHPAVFDARHRSRPLELVRYPLELVVTERRGGYHIALSHTAAEPTVFLEAETPARYRVVEFPERMLTVQEILGRRGLTVPHGARDQLVALIRRDNPALPVRDEIGAVEQSALTGQPAPVVQLVPHDDGLRLNLVVRPFGAEGPAYIAGLGGRSVLANIGGQQLRANRDLPRELAERIALVEACPTLRDRGGADAHEVVIDDLEGCLDLLLELQAYAGPVSVEWPEGQTLRVSAVTPEKLRLRVGQDRDWFSVDGTVAVDEGQVLDMRFLLDRLARAQGRFVPLDDGRFVALTRQMQAQLGRLAAVSEPHRAGRRVHALGAAALDAVLDEAGEIKADAAWTRHVARIRAAEGWTPKLPPTLQAELRDYQVEGFTWMSRLARWGAGACLADDMGLGKTVQAIAVMLDHAEAGPCLVVAPTSVCPNWQAEIARFAPTLATHRLSAASDRAALVAGLGPRDVLVCSYGLLHQEAELLGGRAWQMAVLDEAQAIKNADSKRARRPARRCKPASAWR